MGLAPHKEFWIEFSILSLCLATNSVIHNNGRCYITIAYIITPSPHKLGLSLKPTNASSPENEWNMLVYDLHYMVLLPWAIRLNKN